jgi:dTMP kinase
MVKKGKFIVIEGTDSSGKTTQFNLLRRKFEKNGISLLVADFPRYYESIWGEMVGEFLTGKYGDFDEVDPHIFVLPYMIDQYTWSRDVGKPWIEKGGVILSNRYFTSNVHQIAKFKTLARKKFRDWLWEAGYESLGLLKPDLVVFIDVPPKVAKKLIKKKSDRKYLRGRKKDLAERDWGHQEASYREYLLTVERNNNWKKVKCVSEGRLDLPIEIHNRVWKVVKKALYN